MSATVEQRKVSRVYQDRRGRLTNGEREWVFGIAAEDTGMTKRGSLAWSREEAEQARGDVLARMAAAGWEVELY